MPLMPLMLEKKITSLKPRARKLSSIILLTGKMRADREKDKSIILPLIQQSSPNHGLALKIF